MNVCSRPGCQTTAGCVCDRLTPQPFTVSSPRTMTVTLPISRFGLTVAYMDEDGNILIRTDQPKPADVRF